MTAKRLIDIVGSSIGLLVSGPIIVAAMVAIRRQDAGPAIFKQTREGFRGKPFTIYKLRTMVVDAEASQSELRAHSHRDGPAFKIANDPRVTPVGRFLRKTCIDELPQLWNVLKGDMSLVGPRPLPWHESRACQRWQRRRLEVRPGLTCDWQINKSSVETFDDWMRLDLRYVDEICLFRDLRLIARTVTVPMSGRGSE
jgi:lipopolysaccharide/colanic/teichoic acid biosynthesis glycosyltransferase